jgi:hypothetical protein
MLKQLSVECCDISSSKRPSLLRKTTESDIRKLSLANTCHKMKERAPLLYSVMMTTATPNRKKYDATAAIATLGNHSVNGCQVLL